MEANNKLPTWLKLVVHWTSTLLPGTRHTRTQCNFSFSQKKCDIYVSLILRSIILSEWAAIVYDRKLVKCHMPFTLKTQTDSSLPWIIPNTSQIYTGFASPRCCPFVPKVEAPLYIFLWNLNCWSHFAGDRDWQLKWHCKNRDTGWRNQAIPSGV